MNRHYLAFVTLFSIIFVGLLGSNVYSDIVEVNPSSSIVISQIQAGGANNESTIGIAATQEYISIYNNISDDIDISDWCLTNKSNVSIICFDDRAENETFHIPSHKYVTVSSDSFAVQNSYIPDFKYVTTNNASGSIAGNNNIISLINTDGLIIDSIKWTTNLDGGKIFERQKDPLFIDQFVDSGLLTDFVKTDKLLIPPSGLEIVTEFDACINVAGIQDIAPDGFTVDESSNCLPPVIDFCDNIYGNQAFVPVGYEIDELKDCIPDVCLNIDELQIFIPAGKELDINGDCVDHDECPNITGIQLQIPDGYKRGINNNCILNLLPLIITELLPNAIGSDENNEFIEI